MATPMPEANAAMPAARWPTLVAAPLLALALLAPVWLPDLPPPTQDGPIHVFMAAVIRLYDVPAFEGFRAYFIRQWQLVPNLTIFLVLRGLLEPLAPMIAEKLLVSGYLLGLPLATWWAAREVGARPWIAVPLIVPLGYGMLFHYGFYNYCYGMVAVMIAIAAYYRADARGGLGNWAGFALAAFLCLATHIFAGMAIVVVIGLAGFWRWVTAGRRAEGWVGGFRRHALPAALALLPIAILILAFVARSGETPESPFEGGDGLDYKLYLLLSQSWLVALGGLDAAFGLVILIVMLLLLYRYLRLGRREETGDHRLLFAFAFLLVVFFIVPNDFGGGGILKHRLQPFVHITLVLWLASRPLSTGFARTATVVLFLLAVAFPIHRLTQFQAVDEFRRPLDGMLAKVADHKTIYTLVVGPLEGPPGEPDPLWRPNPLLHNAGYVGAICGVVFLNAYQAHSRNFPVHYRPEWDLHDFMVGAPDDGVAQVLAAPDLERFNDDALGRSIDYVLLAGRAERAPSPVLRPFMAVLERDYRLVAERNRPGPLLLYERER